MSRGRSPELTEVCESDSWVGEMGERSLAVPAKGEAGGELSSKRVWPAANAIRSVLTGARMRAACMTL